MTHRNMKGRLGKKPYVKIYIEHKVGILER